LLSNAIKFSEKSIIEVKAWTADIASEEHEEFERSYLFISIRDFGCGIPENEKTKIFL
jgi:signal transduction histidine kinase